MLRIAEPDEGPQGADTDLCRLLHPSYGLPRRLVLVALGQVDGGPRVPADDVTEGDEHLAEITRIDTVPRFLAGRPSGATRRLR